jgi:ubiquinone/menaquinone biosynthesis C-methylase UbiE
MPLAGSALFFDRVADKYATWYSAPSPGGFALRVRRQKALELLRNANGRILDVGCGPGVMTQDLMDLGWEFCGVDASPNMIREGQRSFGNTGRAHFTVGDASRLPFVTGSFDAVISMGVIDRLPAPEAAVSEMTRVLRKKGTLILAFANLLSPYAAWKGFVYYPILARLRPIYHRLAGRLQPPALPSSLPRLYTPGSATRLLAKHGAEVSRTVFYNSNIFLSPLDEFFPRGALRVTERLEGSRCETLHRLGAGFLLQAHKRS